MIYPRPDAWQEAGQGIEPRILVASSPWAPSSPQWLPVAKPPPKQPPSAPLPPPRPLSGLCHLSGFTLSCHLLPPPSTHPLCSHLVTWLPRVYLTVTALAQVYVCQAPHLCLLVFIRLCPVYPFSLEATNAHLASWYRHPLLWALTFAHSRCPVMPPASRHGAQAWEGLSG